MKQQPNPKALLPVWIFLILYLGSGLYFEYFDPAQERMGFYVIPIVIAFGIALVSAFVLNRTLTFDEKIHICAQSAGDDNIVIMLFIFLMAGAFSGLAREAGGAMSTANLLLDLIPGNFALPGMFVIGCLISMAMGTSVGTITVLVPVAAAAARNAGLSLPLMIGAVVSGSMFGDNLSFISDTTIAATRTQGVEMKDKFRTNLKIALPAAAATLAILVCIALAHPAAEVGTFDYDVFLALPYLIVLIMAFCGCTVFQVLISGIGLFLLAGIFRGTITFSSVFTAMGSGSSGMYETMIVTVLAASLSGLIRADGGFAAIIQFIQNHARGKKGGMAGICLLTGFMDIATANNTVAIVIAAPIAKELSAVYDIDPKVTASLLDTSSCIFQALIPYGAQLLIAAGLSGLSSLAIMPWLFYPYLLAAAVIISIVR